MARETFIEKKFKADSMDLIYTANEILKANQGW